MNRPDQLVIGLIEPASQAHEALIDAGLVPEPYEVIPDPVLRYHEHLNAALNNSVARLERRDAAFFQQPSATGGRLKRQALAQCHALLGMAEQCASHYEFHP